MEHLVRDAFRRSLLSICVLSFLFAVSAKGQQFTIDWNAIGFVEKDTVPSEINTYFDEVNNHKNPLHGLGASTGGVQDFLSQNFSNVAGSGIDMTIWYSRNMHDQSSSNRWGPNLYGSTGGTNPDARVTGNYALRMTRDVTANTTLSGGSNVRSLFTTVLSFSEPITLDEFLMASLSRISDYEHVVIRAFSGPDATGSVVKASGFINESDESDDSNLLHQQGGWFRSGHQ